MRILKVCADARYTNDAEIFNPDTSKFEEDTNAKMPCLKGTNWCPEVDVDRGVIINWTQGVEAIIHYKVCDCFSAEFLVDGKSTLKPYEGYVPDCMCPADEGYGDYIVMHVNPDGSIDNWKVSEFECFLFGWEQA